jgi:hypothetical protein
MFCEKKLNRGFEIGKTGILPVSVLTIQYRIGNTTAYKVFYNINAGSGH